MDIGTFLTALRSGIRAFVRAIAASLRQMFHQIAGVFFFVFFVLGLAALVREWGKWTTAKLVVTAVFTVVFAWFTVESFWRARKSQ